jgi:hypothetical protein
MMLERLRKLLTSGMAGSLKGSAGRIAGIGARNGGPVVLPVETTSMGGATGANNGVSGTPVGVGAAKGGTVGAAKGTTVGVGTDFTGTAAGANPGTAGGVTQNNMVRSEAEDPKRSS